MTERYDLVVLGAGPGGYVASIYASQIGLSVCIIEKDSPGGVCLNWGCIPSKNLLNQAEIFSSISDLEKMGLKIDKEHFDYEKIWKNSRLVSETLVQGIKYLLKKNKIEYVKGTGKITGNKEITVDGRVIQGDNLIIATGSRPKEIPGFGIDEKIILSSTGILNLKKIPENLIILGAGAIGVEFAHIMNTFGSKVTLVEAMSKILPNSDNDISSKLADSFKKRGIDIKTETKAVSIEIGDNTALVTLEQGGKNEKVIADKVLLVVGRTLNTDGIGLEDLNIKTDRGRIDVGDYYQTSVNGIYAIGDIINSPMLAHVASKEGEIAVDHIVGREAEKRLNENEIPMCVYTEPQTASFGLTEEMAIKQGLDFETSSFPYRGIGKAVAIGKTEGFVKIIYDKKIKEILGAHIIGKDATEIIHEILLAKKMEILPENIADMVHAHPTLSESVMEVMKMVDGEAIHI